MTRTSGKAELDLNLVEPHDAVATADSAAATDAAATATDAAATAAALLPQHADLSRIGIHAFSFIYNNNY